MFALSEEEGVDLDAVWGTELEILIGEPIVGGDGHDWEG